MLAPLVAEIMTRSLLTASPRETVDELIEKMCARKIRRLPVVEKGKLVGIVSMRDVVGLFALRCWAGCPALAFRGAFDTRAGDIMATKVVCVRGHESVVTATDLMKRMKVGGLPVVDYRNRLIGIVTERDLLRLFADFETTMLVEYAMTRSVVTAQPDDTLLKACKSMVEHRFRRLPVAEEGKLVGIITMRDILVKLRESKALDRPEDILSLAVNEFMTKSVVTIAPSETLGRAARLMVERNVGALPVVEGGRLVGIVTERDVVETFPRHRLRKRPAGLR